MYGFINTYNKCYIGNNEFNITKNTIIATLDTQSIRVGNIDINRTENPVLISVYNMGKNPESYNAIVTHYKAGFNNEKIFNYIEQIF